MFTFIKMSIFRITDRFHICKRTFIFINCILKSLLKICAFFQGFFRK